MNRLFNKKRKKSPESSSLPGIPTNAVAGSVSHQVGLNIRPEGANSLSCQYPEADSPDPIVSLDERGGGESRVAFQDRMDEDQELPASEAWTSGVVIDGTERGDDPTSKCS